jgi:hypothetical protein
MKSMMDPFSPGQMSARRREPSLVPSVDHGSKPWIPSSNQPQRESPLRTM